MTSMASPVRTRSAPETSRAGRVLLLVVLLAVVVAAVAGAVLATNLVQTRSERAAVASLADPTTTGLGLGQSVRTSFGAMTVAEATVDNGLSSEDLGGMNHGVSSLVSSGFAEINVVVTLNNTSHHPVVVQAPQFRLLTGRGDRVTGKPIPASVTTLAAGLLPGRSVIDARVTFVTATNGSQMWLQYTDPGLKTPVRVALGTTAKIAQVADAHKH
jgi:hypothetical protein